MTDAAPLTSTNVALIIRAKAWKDAGHGVALAFVMNMGVVTTPGRKRHGDPRRHGRRRVGVRRVCRGCRHRRRHESLTTGSGQRLDFGVADARRGRSVCPVAGGLPFWSRRSLRAAFRKRRSATLPGISWPAEREP